MRKKMNKINDYNILYINIQLFLTICSTVLFIMYLFNNKVLWLLEIVAGITLFSLAFNNYKIFKKEKFTVIYLIVGIITLICGVFTLIGS